MREVGGRVFTVVLLMAGVAATPNSLPACEHDCSTNPVEIGALPGYERSRVKQINNHGDIVGQAVRASEEPLQVAALWRRVRAGRYQAEVLPPLDGFDRSEARGFATRFVPVGYSFQVGGTQRATAWPMDRFAGLRVAVDLEPPPGFTDARVFSGNGIGLAVGEVRNPREAVDGVPIRHAAVWRSTWNGGFAVCDLGVPEGYLTSTANDVNSLGLVVGTVLGRSENGQLTTDAVVWRPLGRFHECRFEAVVLPSAADATVVSPAINEAGTVVAQGAGTPLRALLWRRVGRHYADPEVLPPPEGFTQALARAINARGDIVGTAQRTVDGVAEARVVLWRRTHRGWTTWMLTSPVDTSRIDSEHLNDRGDVIADTTAPAAGSSGAYLWTNATNRHCPPRRGVAEAGQDVP